VSSDNSSSAGFELVPWFRVNGIEHNGYEGQIVREMQSVASSEENELIRYLALYLVFHVPGGGLEPERRGLEVPYQAIQMFYEKSYKKARPGTEGRAELEAASVFSRQLPGASTTQNTASAKNKGFTVAPGGCKMPDCDFVDTLDYQLTEQGGFVVKSLPRRLTLSHNYATPDMHHDSDEGGIRPADDGGQVGDCFGRCGRECGDWTHEWISHTDTDYTYCRDVQFPPEYIIDCNLFCCVEERQLIMAQGIAVHTAHGKVTPGSIAHDWCCRNLFLGCYNPLCMALLPGAADCFTPGIGWEETWSYVGPHMESSDYRIGCCYQ